MEFIITRTSGRSIYNSSTQTWEAGKPCEGAVLKNVDRWEIRTLKTEEEFDKRFGASEGLWRSKGVDHTHNKHGYITRRFPNDEQVWVIQFNYLEELVAFAKEDEIIINGKAPASLEIYDSYRE